MTRTVDATLAAALAAGAPLAYAKATIGYTNGGVIYTGDALAYKLTGNSLQFEMDYHLDFAGDQTSMWLERGLTIGGVKYSLTSSRFYIRSQKYLANGHQVAIGSLFPHQYYSIDGHDTYENIITAFCTYFGKTAVFKDAGAAWRGYNMLAATKFIRPTDANMFFALLRQKYLIFAADAGSEQIRFYHAGTIGAPDFTITPTADFSIDVTQLNNRQFIWIDEAGVTHTDGTATNPYHNLGYLEAACSPPVRHTPSPIASVTLRPNLSIMDGDIVELDFYSGSSFKYFAEVTEEYAAGSKGKPPTWNITAAANKIFDTTEAGAVVSNTSGPLMPIQQALPFAPVQTNAFGTVLSARDSNLQTALETLDGHVHAGSGGDKWTEIVKPADQDVTNTTTYADDTDLHVAVTADTYLFEFFLLYSGNAATRDYKGHWYPAAGNISGWHRYIGDNTLADASLSLTAARDAGSADILFTAGTDSSDSVRMLYIEAMISFSQPTTFQYAFAQNSALAGTHARTKQGSILRYRKLSTE